MKKIILIGLGVIIILAVVYIYLSKETSNNVPETDITEKADSPKNATYKIDNTPVTLVDGLSEKIAAPESSTMIITKYFGNEVKTDLNDDGREDVVFLLTQNTGGSGTFFYVVAALNTEDGWVGSRAFLLGDRIAPQTTEVSNNPNHKNVIVVNYAERGAGEPMTEQPSVGKSVWLKLDVDSMTFGTVEQDFPGEANPDIMTLDMQTWTWLKTTNTDGSEITPKQTKAFTLTFNKDDSVSATTDCNSMGGTYEVDGDQITFGSLISTLMACADSQEQDFSKILTEAQSFSFTSKGELVFKLKADGATATFR